MGAGGRDFHVFNCVYRDSEATRVVAFTATQIPHIDHRVYPPILAGPHYPEGIPIHPEDELEKIVRHERVDEVVFAYSDVPYSHLDSLRLRIESWGPKFSLFDPEEGLLETSKPCVAICAVRTGCGKSPLSRLVAGELKAAGRRPGVIRHPMPYGNLSEQVVQRFATVDDLNEQNCTIEEMEEYEPHILAGHVVYAGADYAGILAMAEAEADVIVWDGGNNDAPFVRPSLLITVLDPLRAGDELEYFPGRWNLERADVLVIGKMDEASPEQIAILEENIRSLNPGAAVVRARLIVESSDPGLIRGKRVLVIEDGPTITHGGMSYGAGFLAAKRAGAAQIVDPRSVSVGQIADAYAAYEHIGPVLPALGYAQSQLMDLQTTIDAADFDTIIVATPIDLGRVIQLSAPVVRVSYRFEECGEPKIPGLLAAALA